MSADELPFGANNTIEPSRPSFATCTSRLSLALWQKDSLLSTRSRGLKSSKPSTKRRFPRWLRQQRAEGSNRSRLYR